MSLFQTQAIRTIVQMTNCPFLRADLVILPVEHDNNMVHSNKCLDGSIQISMVDCVVHNRITQKGFMGVHRDHFLGSLLFARYALGVIWGCIGPSFMG